MNYVITNIRFPEEDYLRLKHEAVRKRKSLSAIVREKVTAEGDYHKSQVAKTLLSLTEKAEKENWKGPNDLAENHDKYFIRNMGTGTRISHLSLRGA